MSNPQVATSIKQLLIETLSLDLTVAELSEETPLLGNFPEFDSMAIVSVITAVEEEYNFMAEDDDLSAEVFETVGSLVEFVETRRQN